MNKFRCFGTNQALNYYIKIDYFKTLPVKYYLRTMSHESFKNQNQ